MPTYPHSNWPIGLCVIINNIEFQHDTPRQGSEIDQERIKDLFEKELHFDVKVHNNLSQREMEDELKSASEKDHENYDMFASVVMSHGSAQNKIIGFDGDYTTVERLMAPFLASKCRSLSEKPKLFFFQYCRGPREQAQALPARERSALDWIGVDSTLPSSTFPHEADFLLAFSTCPSYVSYRDEESGSTFIQILVDVIEEYHSSIHLLDMLTEVNRRVAEDEDLQISAPAHTLRKKVFL